MEQEPSGLPSSRMATPGEAELQRGGNDGLTAASRAFGFPYPVAYRIQIDLMQAVFRAIEDGKVGLFESPTGTGKSLSLLCAAFTWLNLNSERDLNGKTEADLGDDPDWVVAHEIKRKREEQTRHEIQLQERIDAARRMLVSSKRSQTIAEKRLKVGKVALEGEEDSEGEFLVHDVEEDHARLANDSAYLSPAVKALMEQLNPGSGQMGAEARPYYARKVGHGQGGEEEEEVETKPKIIYASRTHTQLSQFISELKKTSFGRDVELVGTDRESEPVRNISLGSRKQMCVNPSVQDLGRRVGMEAMNERCLELMKGGSTKGVKSKRCKYLPPPDGNGQAQMLEYRDSAFTQVQDIEDLVELGQKMHICPYFGARSSARQAQLVTLPYNLLLQSNARASLNISLKDSIVIIDEAHNLIDTILSIHTVSVTSKQIKQAQEQIHKYLERFSMKLKGANEVNLKKLLKLLESLGRECNGQSRKMEKGKMAEEIVTGTSLMRSMGGNLDQVNLIELERWLKDTQIARKVAGYAEKQNAALVDANTLSKQSALSAMHTIEAFLLSLANQSDDGRVLISYSGPKASAEAFVTLKYQLLNPADVFEEIVTQARAVILAGGTMEPTSDFSTQLLPRAEKEGRLVRFSCDHVIPPDNLMAAVVAKGPKGSKLEFKFEARADAVLLDDLTNCIANYCNVVPHGLVVFLPSYAFLDALVAQWRTGKGLSRIASRKAVFYEPKLASEVEGVLRDYSLAASSDDGGGGGAILFAVVGAKLSEGINFSDRLARAVIMVGMPFANSASAELNERMKYVRTTAKTSTHLDPGQELYVNLCMKAVNQSIGRAIRHQSDYAALILLDQRYGRKDIRDRLPAWIRPSVQTYDSFGPSMAALGAFFRIKKAKEAR